MMCHLSRTSLLLSSNTTRTLSPDAERVMLNHHAQLISRITKQILHMTSSIQLSSKILRRLLRRRKGRHRHLIARNQPLGRLSYPLQPLHPLHYHLVIHPLLRRLPRYLMHAQAYVRTMSNFNLNVDWALLLSCLFYLSYYRAWSFGQ